MHVCFSLREWTIMNSMKCIILGEFGMVYRALLTEEDSAVPTAVAVKTLKGIALLYTSPCKHRVT